MDNSVKNGNAAILYQCEHAASLHWSSECRPWQLHYGYMIFSVPLTALSWSVN